MAEQIELQPGHLRSRSMDGESNDRERGLAPRSSEREHRTVYGGTSPLAAEPSGPAGCCRERPELERYQSAGVGRLRPVWKRQDRAEGERQPQCRTRLDPLRLGEQSPDHAADTNAADVERHDISRGRSET